MNLDVDIADAKLESGLTSIDILAALDVAIEGGSDRYSLFIYTGDIQAIFPSIASFTVNLNVEIRDEDIPTFINALLSVWSENHPGKSDTTVFNQSRIFLSIPG